MNKSYLMKAIRDTRGAPSAGTVGNIAHDSGGPAVTDIERAKRLCRAMEIEYTGQSLATVEGLAATALGSTVYESGGYR